MYDKIIFNVSAKKLPSQHAISLDDKPGDL